MTLRITLALAALAVSAFSQTTNKVEVNKGKVVYVSGQDLVVKMADGKVKHIVVPKDFKFKIDGKEVSAPDLKPGTELTQTITTTKKETDVTDVRNVDVVVKDVKAPYVVVQDADGKVKEVKVPDGTKINIEGTMKTVFDLRPGMKLKGTVVTTTPETLVSSQTTVTGKAPPAPAAKASPAAKAPPATPDPIGVLLFEETTTTR